MIHKLLGLVLIWPMLTALICTVAVKPAGFTDAQQLICCGGFALVVEAYLIGLYFLFK